MVEIIWSEKSKDDLKQIYEYIYFRSPFYAKRTIQKLRQKTQILKHNVETGKIVPEFNVNTIRELLEGNYRIVYQINSKNKAEIVTVYHAKRDMTKLII